MTTVTTTSGSTRPPRPSATREPSAGNRCEAPERFLFFQPLCADPSNDGSPVKGKFNRQTTEKVRRGSNVSRVSRPRRRRAAQAGAQSPGSQGAPEFVLRMGHFRFFNLPACFFLLCACWPAGALCWRVRCHERRVRLEMERSRACQYAVSGCDAVCVCVQVYTPHISGVRWALRVTVRRGPHVVVSSVWLKLRKPNRWR